MSSYDGALRGRTRASRETTSRRERLSLAVTGGGRRCYVVVAVVAVVTVVPVVTEVSVAGAT